MRAAGPPPSQTMWGRETRSPASRCCARAASGHAAAAPPSSVMNSRVCHSFDHLVGAGEQRRVQASTKTIALRRGAGWRVGSDLRHHRAACRWPDDIKTGSGTLSHCAAMGSGARGRSAASPSRRPALADRCRSQRGCLPTTRVRLHGCPSAQRLPARSRRYGQCGYMHVLRVPDRDALSFATS